MNILKATKEYETWLGQQTQIVAPDLRSKHKQMAENPFRFLRATFYRWMQLWPEACGDLMRAPKVLGVGDLHVENFGTWRDTDGRLVWGINDFDEADQYPYTVDLVRLAASAVLAARGEHLDMRPRHAVEAILEGYLENLRGGGRPFVLAEDHGWLRAIAENKLRDPVRFWKKIDQLPGPKGKVPQEARQALEQMLPQAGLRYRLAHRTAGLGSLGRMRFVAVADWNGGRLAREAKALTPPSGDWLQPKSSSRKLWYSSLLRGAVRCPDPYVACFGNWVVRRLSPHCSRIELENLETGRGELRLLEAMGRETANIHLGTRARHRDILRDLHRRKGNWLKQAAEAMVKLVERDWKVWKKAAQT